MNDWAYCGNAGETVMRTMARLFFFTLNALPIRFFAEVLSVSQLRTGFDTPGIPVAWRLSFLDLSGLGSVSLLLYFFTSLLR